MSKNHKIQVHNFQSAPFLKYGTKPSFWRNCLSQKPFSSIQKHIKNILSCEQCMTVDYISRCYFHSRHEMITRPLRYFCQAHLVSAMERSLCFGNTLFPDTRRYEIAKMTFGGGLAWCGGYGEVGACHVLARYIDQDPLGYSGILVLRV